MKKIAFKKLARMTEDELQDIYELTYKYGWLVSEERQTGWLPDRAYLEKAKIEGSLGTWIDYGLEELGLTYNEWLDFHLPDGWTDSMMESFEGSDLNAIADQFKWWTNTPSALLSDTEIFDKIREAAWKALGGEDYFKQDMTNLYETFGPEFIEMHIGEISDVEDQEKMEEKWEEATSSYSDYEIAEQFIYENDLDSAFDEYMDAMGFGGLDWFMNLYEIYNISAQFPQLVDDKDFYRELYHVYLENFPGLEEEIDGIAQTNDEISNAEDGSLQDKIIAFQLGLTTAHHHGTMADHLLDVRMGEGKIILDKISSGPNVDLWDKELAQIIGFKSPEETQEYFVPESAKKVIAVLQTVLEAL